MELRKAGNFENYEKQENGEFICLTCGFKILAVTVRHSVHLRELSFAGFGEVETSQAPYCPKCETKPSEIGGTVYYD